MKRLIALLTIVLTLLSFLFVAPPLSVAAGACEAAPVQDGQSQLTTDTVLKDPTCAYQSIGPLIGLLLTLALIAGALTALFFFVLAAIQWITAKAGDGAAKARMTMIYAVVGLVGLSMVYVFMKFYGHIIP
jgi:hypothetical protein